MKLQLHMILNTCKFYAVFVFFPQGNPKGKNKTFVENNAFDTIGDDDL